MTFHVYGFILGISIMVGWWLAARWWRKLDSVQISFDMIGVWVVLGGVVGARLYHVIDYWWYYQTRLFEIMAVWQGGLAIWGAILGGFFGLVILSRWKRLPLFVVLDIFAVVLPLSQSIGRWGNWVNFELYGKPTTLPWGWWIPSTHRPLNMMEIAYYHPLFLYESILMLVLFGGLYFWGRKRWLPGSGRLFGMYLIGYGLIRFFLEPLRITSWSLYGIPVAQFISLAALLIGVCLYMRVGWDNATKIPVKTKY